jgi:putative ABC transport system substrate-binding protein
MAKIKTKTSLFISVLSLLFICLAGLPPSAFSSDDEVIDIAVVLSRKASPYDASLAGFEEGLSGRGVKYNMSVFDLDGSLEEGHRLMKDLKAGRPDVVLAVGSTATEVAYNEAQAYPVIFTMVLYPKASGFVHSMAGSKNNMAGASLDVDPRQQFDLLRSLVPGLERIGVIYNPIETRATVEEAKIVADEMGMELVAVEVYSSKKVPEALGSLRGRVDALWSVADSTVFNSKSINYIISYTLKNRIPFMGISSHFVRDGALVSISPNYFDVGAQAGEIAARVIAGKSTASIPIARPRKVSASINLRTAWKIGLKPTSDVLSRADEVIK